MANISDNLNYLMQRKTLQGNGKLADINQSQRVIRNKHSLGIQQLEKKAGEQLKINNQERLVSFLCIFENLQ